MSSKKIMPFVESAKHHRRIGKGFILQIFAKKWDHLSVSAWRILLVVIISEI